MVGFVSARFVVSRLVALWRVNNHSRDRHGSTFDGAGWDGSRRGQLCCVEKSRGLFGLGEFCHGYQPPRGRRGFGFDAGWWLVFRRVSMGVCVCVCVCEIGRAHV